LREEGVYALCQGRASISVKNLISKAFLLKLTWFFPIRSFLSKSELLKKTAPFVFGLHGIVRTDLSKYYGIGILNAFALTLGGFEFDRDNRFLIRAINTN
jgi:hypothetical protein